MFCSHMKAIDNGNGKVAIKDEGFRKLALRWSFENGNLFSFKVARLDFFRAIPPKFEP